MFYPEQPGTKADLKKLDADAKMPRGFWKGLFKDAVKNEPLDHADVVSSLTTQFNRLAMIPGQEMLHLLWRSEGRLMVAQLKDTDSRRLSRRIVRLLVNNEQPSLSQPMAIETDLYDVRVDTRKKIAAVKYRSFGGDIEDAQEGLSRLYPPSIDISATRERGSIKYNSDERYLAPYLVPPGTNYYDLEGLCEVHGHLGRVAELLAGLGTNTQEILSGQNLPRDHS